MVTLSADVLILACGGLALEPIPIDAYILAVCGLTKGYDADLVTGRSSQSLAWTHLSRLDHRIRHTASPAWWSMLKHISQWQPMTML